jgi:predicted ATP-grasp superfamily ATP-dependent carboligase
VRAPEDLYHLHDEAPELGHPVLLHSFTGFLDAGSAGRLATEHLLATLDARVLATFDTDELLDYRARRPRMTFVEDRFTDMSTADLVLYELTDAEGTPFLLLTGPEPDFQWQRFVAAVHGLVERFGVRLTVGITAIPWPAPHTRPVALTAHATDRSLVGGRTPWVGTVEVPGHVSAVLELKLGEAGHAAMGFAAHVPHYLAQVDYPQASVALLQAVSRATGLALPSDALRLVAERTDEQIRSQLGNGGEYAAAVRALEEQYDAAAGDRPGIGVGPDVPTAEEIGDQVEQFLAGLDGDDGR